MMWVSFPGGHDRGSPAQRRRKFCSRITCASSNLPAARRFADRFKHKYPNAVAYLRNDLDELLTCFRDKFADQRKAVRTTNAIERRFREVRRRTRPTGTFQDKISMDRILFAIFTHENKSQNVSTLFLLTQNN
jgi:transposase-like protein